MTIKERVIELEKLESKEGIRHVKACNKLNEIGRRIKKDCRHTNVKTVQLFPESLDICDDCGKVIL